MRHKLLQDDDCRDLRKSWRKEFRVYREVPPLLESRLNISLILTGEVSSNCNSTLPVGFQNEASPQMTLVHKDDCTTTMTIRVFSWFWSRLARQIRLYRAERHRLDAILNRDAEFCLFKQVLMLSESLAPCGNTEIYLRPGKERSTDYKCFSGLFRVCYGK